MAVTEQDLETLEVWLDGELPELQADALRQRLSAEPELAQTLDRLRGERKIRAAAWITLEPADAEVEALVSNVRRGMRKEDLVSSRLRVVRNFSSVAAGVAVVFMAGWLSHGRLQVGTTNPNDSVVTNQPAPSMPLPPRINTGINSGSNSPLSGDIRYVGTGDPTVRQSPQTFDGLSQMRPRYRVNVVSPMGRVYQRELEKLSDLADMQQLIESAEAAAEARPTIPSLGPQR